jgi:hypothetical protein
MPSGPNAIRPPLWLPALGMPVKIVSRAFGWSGRNRAIRLSSAAV